MIHPDTLFGRLGNRMFQMAYIYAQMKEGKIPDIYLQDNAYFDTYEKEIKELFGEDIVYIPLVSIHLRRGDYVKNPFYVDLSETMYYQRAMSMFPNDTFLVFSDDMEFAKDYFQGHQFIFSEGNSELEDLNTMAGCKSNIIANSSFSWWAGYLNPHINKTVVAPKRYYTDGIERTKYPDTWKTI